MHKVLNVTLNSLFEVFTQLKDATSQKAVFFHPQCPNEIFLATNKSVSI